MNSEKLATLREPIYRPALAVSRDRSYLLFNGDVDA
jgi:hypothetical protein